MYQKIYIDKKIKNLITEKIEKVFSDRSIPFEFLEDLSINDRNSLYITDNKERLSENLINVFILRKEYDFLDVKNAIFIRNIEDVVNVLKNDVWKKWAQELQFLAQCSLAYSKDKFDRERSERIRDIACEMLSYKYDLPIEKIKMDFASEIGYQTPKVETRAAIIKDDKILLVKEQLDGKWALPGGYQDVNVSIRENVIKEASEEAGAVVQPLKVVAVLDYNRHHHVNFPLGMVKIFVLCEYINHSFNENTETLGAEFYSLDDLPELSLTRTTKKQLEMCFECYKDPQNWDTIFD
ncbi:NUDIX hydrolase [Gemella haemolysans]|uniref:Hydrolase, NUDIX family n=1 Tax=Gemella haemolysans ATCC 10379 TaxID=546270 RepID=C5NYV7_9BACL|nr:NUDIX hydrolase [Gemella haemolysans]EER68027.1 hydrolase, NUDIX family [Gemella haemolysans ATCC 10379]KAA8709446.1 NUDIX hydrolase [Gemella haemolysans]UBH83145.1 NUDIX hydrolase [Gemella haemolysans]VEI38578.1 Hydrolase of X-linked nucleoside diphosphate N terminal [Gemella haemolysans]